MNIKIRECPFKIENEFYNYENLINEEVLIKEGYYYIIFQYDGTSNLKNFKKDVLKSLEYIEFISTKNQTIKLNKGTAVLLRKEISNNDINKNHYFFGSLKKDAYFVNKPWGYEYWITGKNPMNELVLKFIHIKKGTKTSLQVHQEKFESNFLVEGEAILSYSKESFTIKKDYIIDQIKINEKSVIDVSPLGIHQLESLSDIYLLESSTNHLDDVIRLKDDSGRGDGKIESEHQNS